MNHTTLLDGNVDDVKKGLAGLDAAALAALLAAEQAGKNRKGVTDAIEEAHTAASTNSVSYTSTTDRGDGAHTTTSNVGAAAVTTAASLDDSGSANITPATTFNPAGVPDQVTDIDVDHIAVDNNPRAHTSVDQNRIDFNDPVRTGSEIVEQNLKDQAKA